MRTFFFSAMLSHFSEDIKSFKSFGLNIPESGWECCDVV